MNYFGIQITLEMYRAFIYLQGGTKDTGAFRQMVGTHIRDYEIKHKLSSETIKEKKLDEKIVVCDYLPGTLIISNINSFHSNTKKITQNNFNYGFYEKKFKI